MSVSASIWMFNSSIRVQVSASGRLCRVAQIQMMKKQFTCPAIQLLPDVYLTMVMTINLNLAQVIKT